MNTDFLLGGGIVFLVLLIIFVCMAVAVVSIIATWILFRKAGKEGWEAIIPVYNNYVLVEIAGLDWWWFLILLAPLVTSFTNETIAGFVTLASFFVTFNCYYNIAKKFKKDTTTAVLAGLFPFIFLLIFAFSKKETYYTEEKVSSNGVFPGDSKESPTPNSTTTNLKVNKPAKLKFCRKCGCKIEDNYKFCSVCGAKYEENVEVDANVNTEVDTNQNF